MSVETSQASLILPNVEREPRMHSRFAFPTTERLARGPQDSCSSHFQDFEVLTIRVFVRLFLHTEHLYSHSFTIILQNMSFTNKASSGPSYGDIHKRRCDSDDSSLLEQDEERKGTKRIKASHQETCRTYFPRGNIQMAAPSSSYFTFGSLQEAPFRRTN
eukprot:scaffold6708_cov134-Cylindrotheca_fusiformis.AAC.28